MKSADRWKTDAPLSPELATKVIPCAFPCLKICSWSASVRWSRLPSLYCGGVRSFGRAERGIYDVDLVIFHEAQITTDHRRCSGSPGCCRSRSWLREPCPRSAPRRAPPRAHYRRSGQTVHRQKRACAGLSEPSIFHVRNSPQCHCPKRPRELQCRSSCHCHPELGRRENRMLA